VRDEERSVATGSAAFPGTVTVVTQTRVRPESGADFARWQEETGRVIAAFPGFIQQKVTPPAPPAQVDWVILQRFTSSVAAVAWLNSEQRLQRLAGAGVMLVGRDDIHIINDARGVLPAPVSAVISTRIKPGQESAYRRWEQRIAAAQSRARGFEGYRFEPPIPGVQDDWLAIVSFDNEENLQAWLDSPERQALLKDASDFTEEFHARIARTSFDQWFPVAAGGTAPPAWKQNMIVILMLYPVVFLFGTFVGTPLLSVKAELPFAVALFIGNVVSVLLLNYLVPWANNRITWWLQPSSANPARLQLAGTALLVALYAVIVMVFWRMF
jgi:antibiotic biosynthesis monooxygenase (ABM) superfamily enzyme